MSDHKIIIAHIEPRPDEPEKEIQQGPFNKIKVLNQYCAKKKTEKNLVKTPNLTGINLK